MILRTLLATSAIALLVGGAAAQTNLEKLGQMKTTGVTDFTFIEQGGAYADGIRKTLERIKMPSGFKIDLYAIVPDARHMAVDPLGWWSLLEPKRPMSGP